MQAVMILSSSLLLGRVLRQLSKVKPGQLKSGWKVARLS